MRWTSAVFSLALAMALPGPAFAQSEPFPNRAVRVIAPAGPGGNPDVLGRLLAAKFAETLGKPFVVENVPGAGGVVAANMVAKAPQDGHVLMLADSGALAINPALNPNTSYRPAEGFHRHHRDSNAADRVRGAAHSHRQHAGRVHRARQEGARQADLRFGWPRLDPSSDHGGVRRPRRHRDAARALPRRLGDGERAARRARSTPAGRASPTCCH